MPAWPPELLADELPTAPLAAPTALLSEAHDMLSMDLRALGVAMLKKGQSGILSKS